MTPKEKAKELVHKYKNMLPRMDYMLLNETSKECALIAVDEIIEVAKLHPNSAEWAWWIKIKEEINNL